MAEQKNGKRRQTAAGKAGTGRRKEQEKRKIIVFAIELVVILMMLVLLWWVMWAPETKKGELDLNDLGINEGAEEAAGNGGAAAEDIAVSDKKTEKKGYMNIALFGVDAQTEKQLYKGSRSDSIMVASINMDTGDIKLVSVYRDTYLNLGTDKYEKCNAAYSYGGAQQAVKMLNTNLDLAMTDFVAVGYEGLSKLINCLGGIYIDVDSEELKHINNYQIGIAEVLKCDYNKVTTTGYQLLDGLQATAYCRIRYTKGDDFMRASRQREVIKAIEEQAKKASLTQLLDAYNEVAGCVYTSIDSDTILELIGNIANYKIVDEDGFPQSTLRWTGDIGDPGNCIVPVSLEDNVVWLHKFLFDDENYTVTESVREYSQKITNDTKNYVNR